MGKLFIKHGVKAILTIALLMVAPQLVRANDYLEKEGHFRVYANGADHVHFVVPVWAEGAYDRYAYGDSYVSCTYKPKGSSSNSTETIAYFKSDNGDVNEKKNSKGSAYLWLRDGMGEIVVTSMASGVDYRVMKRGGWTDRMEVTQKEDDGCSQVTVLEFDWYPPEKMDSIDYTVKIVCKSMRCWDNVGDYKESFTSQDYGPYKGLGNVMTPQLYSPYIYQVNENGPVGYGYAGIPYMLFNEPISYTTSLNSHPEPISDRGGMLYVMTNDTIQYQFYANFTMWRGVDNVKVQTTRKSTAVDIPPYHRIYDFLVKEETDSTGTFTGSSVLTWNVKNPGLKDIVDGDYFEIQRALKDDYSDARTIEVVQFVCDPKKTQYSYTDKSRETWTGNTGVKGAAHLEARESNYVVYDSNGEALAEVDAHLHANNVVRPGMPVYYRIRRASSSVWGWEQDFAKKVSLVKHNFLAPLADNQQPYTLDKNFKDNRQVHFKFHIENKEVTAAPSIPKESCKLTYSLNKVLKQGSMGLTLMFEQGRFCDNPEGRTLFRVTDIDGNLIHDWKALTEGVYIYPRNSTLQVKNVDPESYNQNEIYTFELYEDSKIRCATEWRMAVQEFFVYFTSDGNGRDVVISELEPYMSAVKDSLYNVMQRENNATSYGRCMWDRSAQLVLTRTIEETGQSVEFVIPQDSIKRQPDGSWIATYSDVADKACSHYKYSVRIDQTRSDLHVQDSVSLLPVALSGPEIYFDEGATINNFTATQGDATTQMKQGVLLRWETNNNNYDQFILLRKEKGTSDAADTLGVFTQSNYLDRSALPGVHYEYTVEAHYTCNGKTSVNAATAEGWRTPYGEISGVIKMTDNTGMAGVEVALQDADGNVIRTIQTDATGVYKFDSLEYIPKKCENPAVGIVYTGESIMFSERLSKLARIRVYDPDGNILEDWATPKKSKYQYPSGFIMEVKCEYGDNRQVYSFKITKNCTLSLDLRRKSGYVYPVFTPTIKNEMDVECQWVSTNSDYSVIPTHQYGTFSFNNTSAPTASITLSQDNAVASGIDFVNTSSTRLTGRVLYKNSTIPVSGAMFLLNGDTVRRGDTPLTSAINGNFELILPLSQPCRLQVFKDGHTFEGDGILRLEGDEEEFALTKPKDGIRFYDTTKARIIGRVAGGNDQRDLPRGFGLGTNNLGDDLQLVLQLEGDNTAQIVHDPNELDRDTLMYTVPHMVYAAGGASASQVGQTKVLYEKKRIIIKPDSITGEFEADLFPVKYKVVQATANGYATLFGSGQGSETFDLTEAPKTAYVAKVDKSAGEIQVTESYGSQTSYHTYPYSGGIASEGGLLDGDSISYNAVYDRIYHTPMLIGLTQMIYGLERKGLGEPEIEVSDVNPKVQAKVNLYEVNPDGTVNYLLDNPVFLGGRKYQFMAEAYEDYYYNNDQQGGRLDRVPLRGGTVTIHNGMHSSTDNQKYALNEQGKNANIWLQVDNYDVNNVGKDALRTVTVALEQEGNIVETTLFNGYLTGTVIQDGDLRMTDADIVLLDIIRDPGGAGSSAWVESGTTYSYSYKDSYDWETGLTIGIKYGLNVSNDIGIVTAPEGVGSYTGSNYTSSKQLEVPIPITHSWSWGHQYDYTITTTERIATSSAGNPKSVGAMADVFLGTTVSQISGKAKTVSLINDSLYNVRKPARDAGTMKVIAQGTGSDGKPYYLVTGQKVVLGSTLSNTFAYSQHHILNTVIPEIAMERQNLLERFGSLEDAQAAAEARGQEVYWYHPTGDDVSLRDSLPDGYYTMVNPNNDNIYNDRVAALDRTLIKWITILYNNEKEKVSATMGGKSRKVGTYSVSYGANFNHTDSYTASANYNEMPQGWDLILYDAERTGVQTGESLAKTLAGNIRDFWSSRSGSNFGTSVADALNDYYKAVEGAEEGGVTTVRKEQKNAQELGTVTNTSKFSFYFEPVLDFESDDRATDVKTIKKSAGFTLVPDADGDITVSVYQVPYAAWADTTALIREQLDNLPEDDDNLYGSYVFHTDAGASYCPHEGEETTNFYNKGTVIGNNTQWLVKPEMTADTYEITNIQPENSAYFTIHIMDNAEIDAGVANDGHSMTLMLNGDSNPNGAVVTVDGMPLTQGISYWVVPGKPMTKTVRVQRGLVDDYENLQLMLYPSDCMKTNKMLNLSVHFMPVSSDVNIAMPRPNWIMNTLSSQDSVGYYIPVDIDGFDILHKNFDHIEFQYKLSTESEEMWVNQCSFYASDSLYNLATGNKAMIENGRIVPFRFYGERDPMEQRYDLRAVTFCRYGSGYVTKSSPVVSGVKDTRPPRVFGEPEPVNAILGVGDNLKLRFNEPIAGNYLDEDNNFQIRGVTNATGITTNASVHFDGTQESYAISKVSRSLSNRSFSLDMMVKPSNTGREETFFEHGTDGDGVRFGLTADNRLLLQLGTLSIYSKPLEKMLEFTRVCVTYDHETKQIHFYAGTKDLTDPQAQQVPVSLAYDLSAPLVFGRGFDGNMLELRLWSKVLTQEEIAATDRHYLSGYEKELVAYYQMAEGHGNTLRDKSGGATLTMYGTSWNLPKGISLAINNGERVQLNGNLLGRSKVYDETLMLWFRPTSDNGDVFSAGRVSDSIGTLLAIEENKLVLHSDSNSWSLGAVETNEWHHFALTVNRTYNNVSAFVDGDMAGTFAATELSGITGAMYFGGNGFEGNVDEFVIFEQALPKTIVEQYGSMSPVGDEMGLIAYLPFEEQKLNKNNELELMFSPNNRRQFKDPNGNVIEKEEPLIVDNGQTVIDNMVDKNIYAPVHNAGLLSNLNFDWAFNNDELLINLNMLDREINKQTITVTVRDVEDLNGNPMKSPVMWVAYVDRNSLTWEDRTMELWQLYGFDDGSGYNYRDIRIVNNSGKRHQFKIESLPEWLTVNQESGTIQPIDDYTVRFTYDVSLPVGIHSDIVYVTDEAGLSEPLNIVYNVEAFCPWDDVNSNEYDNSMSLRGQVMIEDGNGNMSYDTDAEDVIAVFCDGVLVGKAKNQFDNLTNKSYVYLTIYGNKNASGKSLSFKLWSASTGKIYTLTPSEAQTYENNAMSGYAPKDPIVLSANEGEVQRIELAKGWNWISMNVFPWNARLNTMFTVAQGFKPGDLVKSPSEQQFAEYALKGDSYQWEGTLKYPDYHYMYMVRVSQDVFVDIEGKRLTDEQRQISLYHGWNSMPYLLEEPMSVRDALADYLDNAKEGDVIKSKDAVAVFSENERWEGSLQTMRPGQGYLFYRQDKKAVIFKYYDNSRVSKYTQSFSAPMEDDIIEFRNPSAGTNMTVIAKIAGGSRPNDKVTAYVGNEKAGVIHPMAIGNDTLVLLTVSADEAEKVKFELVRNGKSAGFTRPMFSYMPDAIYGTPKEPVLLNFAKSVTATPNPFTDHVDFHLGGLTAEDAVNIRIYSAVGAMVAEIEGNGGEQVITWNDGEKLSAGIYNAVVNINGEITTIKLIKR